MEIDPLTDELFLRLVLERQPGAAPKGKKDQIWYEIALAVNDASDREVFRTARGACQRFTRLLGVLDDEHDARHAKLTREMREMLVQIRGAMPSPPTTRVRTRSQAHASSASREDQNPLPKRRRASAQGGATSGGDATAVTAADDHVAAVPASNALVPYALEPFLPARSTTMELERYLGAQAERDRQACFEREQLRRELMDCKRDAAVHEHAIARLENTRCLVQAPEPAAVPAPAAASSSTERLLVDVMNQQQLTLEEMKCDRASHRQQVATMMAMMQHAFDGATNGHGSSSGGGHGDESAMGADRSSI